MEKEKIVTFNHSGHSIKMAIHEDHIGRIMTNGKTFYESGMLKAIEKLNLKGTYIDVGANIGNHTVFFGKLKDVKVKSFEPVPENFKKLESNVSFNNIDCEIFSVIASDSNTKSYKINTVENNMGSCYFIESKDPTLSIKSATIDSYKFDDVSLIKIDVEGMEYSVILGALDTINKYKPDLFIEIHDNDPMKDDILNVLRKIGYKKLQRYNASPTYHFSMKS